MKLRRAKCLVAVLIMCLFAIVSFSVVPSKVSFAIHNKVSFSEIGLYYIDNHTAKKIKKCAVKSQQATYVYLTERLKSGIQINDIFKYQNRLFVDVTQVISNEETHIIYETDGNNFHKYVEYESNVITNKNNKNVKKSLKVFETTDASVEKNIQYADPFSVDENKFVEKHKVAGLEEKVFIEKENQEAVFAVYETIEIHKSRDILYEIYPIETELPIIAMANKTTVSNVVKWFSENAFNENGHLMKETLLCKEKQIEFRYGRQVGIRQENADKEKTIIDEWENGVAKLALQQPFLVNFGDNCIASETIHRPLAMDLCDDFFIKKALLNYNENSDN